MSIIDITTCGLQQAIDSSQPGDTVLVPQGITCQVDAVNASVRPKAGTTLQIDGTLQAATTDQRLYNIVMVENVADVTIVLNGQIIGDTDTHPNKADDHGFGIGLIGAIRPKIVGSGTITKCTGDGVYVSGACKDVFWRGFTSTGNWRQGASVVDVDGIDADGVSLLNSGSNPPSAGIDFEPDVSTQAIRKVKMRNCKMLGNKGASLLICCAPGQRSNIDIDSSNQFDSHPIDGTDGIVPWYAKWWFYVFKSYWLYPRSVKL